MNTVFDAGDLAFIEACRAGRAPTRPNPRRRRGRKPMGPEERRQRQREWQRRRREDLREREKDRAYAREHYYRNREKRLRQMKEYQQRCRAEESNGKEHEDGEAGGRGDGIAHGRLPAMGAG